MSETKAKFARRLTEERKKYVPCPAVYRGETYPQMHGLKCQIAGAHPGRRHLGGHLSWWTEEEKVAIRKGKHGDF